MTLKDFLLNGSYGIDLNNHACTATQKIRENVKDIDELINKDISDICEDDIREIFIAILWSTQDKRNQAVWGDEALNKFEKEKQLLAIK